MTWLWTRSARERRLKAENQVLRAKLEVKTAECDALGLAIDNLHQRIKLDTAMAVRAQEGTKRAQ